VNGTSPTLCSSVITRESAKDPSQCSLLASQCASVNATCCSGVVTPTNATAGNVCQVNCNIHYTTALRVQYETGTITIRTHQAWLRYDYGTNLEAAVARKGAFPVNLVQECWYDSDDLSSVSFDEPSWTWWKWLLLALPSAVIIVLCIVLTTQKFAKSTRCSNPHLPASAIWLGVIIPIVILVPIVTGNITDSSRAALICAITSFVAVGLCALTLPCIQSCNQVLPCAPGLIVCCCLVIPVGVFLPIALIGNVSSDTRTILYIIAPSLTIFPILFGLFYVCYESSERRKLYGKGPVRLPDGDDCSPECWCETTLCPCYAVARCCTVFWNPPTPTSPAPTGRKGRRVSPVDGRTGAWPGTSLPTPGGVNNVAAAAPVAGLSSVASPSAVTTTGLDTSRRDTVMIPSSPLHTERGTKDELSTMSMAPGTPMAMMPTAGPQIGGGVAMIPLSQSTNIPLRRLTLHPGHPGHQSISASPLGPRSMSFAAPSGVGFNQMMAAAVAHGHPGIPALTMPPPSPTLTFHYPQGATPMLAPSMPPMLPLPPLSARHGGEHSPHLPLPQVSARGGAQHFSFIPHGFNGSPRLSVPSLALTPAQQAALAAHAQGHSLGGLPAGGAMTTPHRGHQAGQSFSFSPEHLHPITARGNGPKIHDDPKDASDTPPNYEGQPQDKASSSPVGAAAAHATPPHSASGHRQSRSGHHLQPSWHGESGPNGSSPSLSTQSSSASLGGVGFHSARHHSIGNAEHLMAQLRGRSLSIDHGSARGLGSGTANQLALELHAELVRINEQADDEERIAADRRASQTTSMNNGSQGSSNSGSHSRVASGTGQVVVNVANVDASNNGGNKKSLANYSSNSVAPPAYSSGSNSRRNSLSQLATPVPPPADAPKTSTGAVSYSSHATSATSSLPSYQSASTSSPAIGAAPVAPIVVSTMPSIPQGSESPQGTPNYTPDERAVRAVNFAKATVAATAIIDSPNDIRLLAAAHNASVAAAVVISPKGTSASTTSLGLSSRATTSTNTINNGDKKDEKKDEKKESVTNDDGSFKHVRTGSGVANRLHNAHVLAGSVAQSASLISTAATALAAVAGVATATAIAVPATAVAAGAATVATVASGVDKILAHAEKVQATRQQKIREGKEREREAAIQKDSAIVAHDRGAAEAASIGVAYNQHRTNVAAASLAGTKQADFHVDVAALQEAQGASVSSSTATTSNNINTGAVVGAAALGSVVGGIVVAAALRTDSPRATQPPMVSRNGYGGLSINVNRSVDLTSMSPGSAGIAGGSPNGYGLTPLIASTSGMTPPPPGTPSPTGTGASLVNRRAAAANSAAAASRLPPLASATGSLSQLQPKTLKPLGQPGSPAGSNASANGRPRSQSAIRRVVDPNSARAVDPSQAAASATTVDPQQQPPPQQQQQ
jgi:hypothetical protein